MRLYYETAYWAVSPKSPAIPARHPIPPLEFKIAAIYDTRTLASPNIRTLT